MLTSEERAPPPETQAFYRRANSTDLLLLWLRCTENYLAPVILMLRVPSACSFRQIWILQQMPYKKMTALWLVSNSITTQLDIA